MSSNEKFVSKSAQELIKKMTFRTYEDGATQEYMDKYVPQILQHNNRKGMSLIPEKLIPLFERPHKDMPGGGYQEEWLQEASLMD